MEISKEIWKPIEGYEGLYEVSNLGRVKSLSRLKCNGRGYWRTKEKLIKPSPDGCGYLQVHLSKDGKETMKGVHLLVWDAFVGEDRTGLEVNHMDEDKNNCVVWNLNLLTHGDNVRWGTGNERRSKALTNHPDKSKTVIALNAEGNVVYEFPSAMEAERNGFQHSAVSTACRGCFHREGNHKYKKLNWYFKDEL